MTSAKDPEKPRPNRELKAIEKVMVQCWRRFRSSEDYVGKRGNAMLLQAHLEAWLEEPETFCDLETGLSSKPGMSHQSGDILENTQSVFQHGGLAGNLFFFRTGDAISQLFTQAELDADPNKSRNYGYYVVVVYEKIYATQNETRMHFTSEDALKRHIHSSSVERWVQKNDFDVLADPRGCPDPGKCHTVFRYRNQKAAMRKADQLAQRYGIRFVVGRVLGWVDNH